LTATNTVLITWPAPSTGYVLEQSPVLGTIDWVVNTNTVDVVNATNEVIVTPGINNMFYLLVNP